MIILVFFIFVLLIFISLTYAATDGYVTISLNRTSYWWNETVVSSGTANYTNGSAMADGSLAVTLSGVAYCSNNTISAAGVWFCVFQAPNQLGTYTFSITVTNSTGSTFTNTTNLYVKPTYGASLVGRTDRVVIEQPMLIQEPTGIIRQVWAKVKIWKSA